MTVGELRKALEGVPDDIDVRLTIEDGGHISTRTVIHYVEQFGSTFWIDGGVA